MSDRVGPEIPEHLRVTPILVGPGTIVEWVKPEPTSELERKGMEQLRPGDYEIFDEKIRTFLDETREVFIRSGVSGMLRAGDLIVALYTANGDLANASAGTYLHCVTAMLPVKYVLAKYLADPSVGVKDGDIFYVNEARFGGIHNPDQMAFMPVFNDGELIAWTAALTHQPETGAIEPGGMPLTASSRHEEGMKLTPIKIGERFPIRQDMLDMMENFISRAPRMQSIDVRARVTGADRLRRRIVDLAADKGNVFLRGLLRKFIVETEVAVRRRISRWNDGTYRAIAFIDTIGKANCLVRGSLTATKCGDSITFDFAGTSPDNDGPFNCFPHIVAAHAAISMYAFPFHDLPVSNGALAPFKWVVPYGTVFNAHPEAAISCSPLLNSLTMSLIPQVMSRMMYDSPDREKVAANISSQGSCPVIAGPNQYGVPIADIDNGPLNTEGHGARPDMDGVNAYGFPWGHAGRAPDSEDSEVEYQFLRLFFNLRIDSCGCGTFRGGAASESAIVPRHVPMLYWTTYSKSSKIPCTLGLFGGYPPASSPGIWVRDTNLWEKMQRGDADIPTSARELATKRLVNGTYVFEHSNRSTRVGMNGDILLQLGGGGAGYGDPLARDPAAVLKDVAEGLVSRWTAEHVYHVRFDSAAEVVADVETADARAAARKTRLDRGRPWKDFINVWERRKPPEDALKYFGEWPTGTRAAPLPRI
jgi:N-methylhydantoinase B/oxoprolinase/acetone carboxylase alpha subunit